MKVRTAASGHTFFVERVAAEAVPETPEKATYDTFYVVRNGDAEGKIFMYLAKGDKAAKREIVAWYANTERLRFWCGYGTSVQSAIEGAQRDGWMYA